MAVNYSPRLLDLSNKINELAEFDWITPAQNPRFGVLNFEEAIPTLDAGARLIGALAQIDLSTLPDRKIDTINSALDRYVQNYSQIRHFDPLQGNPAGQRSEILQSLRDLYNQLFDTIAVPIGVHAATNTDIEKIRTSLSSQISNSINESEKAYKAALANIEAANKHANETLDAIKKAAGQVGVTENATIFETQATEHQTSSFTWGILTAIMAAVTVGWGAIALWIIPIPAGADASRIVQEAIAKLIVFSGLSYGLVWCARNYSANRHNYVLNKHRQNSLRTFETFVKAAGDDVDTKNAVLLQATTAIFAAQGTGYSTGEPDVEQPNKILEIVRSARGN